MAVTWVQRETGVDPGKAAARTAGNLRPQLPAVQNQNCPTKTCSRRKIARVTIYLKF
jgi:hypothetical protein